MGKRSSRQRLEAELDGLYRLPPGEFTAARNGLASRLAAAGRREDARRVRSLRRPGVAAWVVNRLFHDEPREFRRLIAAGRRLQRIRGGDVPGPAAVQRLIQRRQAIIAHLVEGGIRLLREADEKAAPALVRRIEATLGTVGTLGEAGDGQRLGRLERDPERPGVDALLSLAAAAGPTGALKSGTRPETARRGSLDRTPGVRRAVAAVDRAEVELVQVRIDLGNARRAVATAKEQLRAVRKRESEVRRQLRRAEKLTVATAKRLDRARRKVRRARTRVQTARKASS